MSKDDIIRMALECDLGRVCGPLDTLLDYEWEILQHFANLVAAYVMAQPCCGNFSTCQQFCMPKGAAVERETIAQMFDAVPELVPFARRGDGGCIMCGFSTSHAATAIRARGNT
jgi:hypothetical protein